MAGDGRAIEHRRQTDRSLAVVEAVRTLPRTGVRGSYRHEPELLNLGLNYVGFLGPTRA